MSTALLDRQDYLYEIETCESVDDALSIYAKMGILEKYLKQVDEFFDQSVKFARMEAATMVKIIELGGVSKLRGHARKTAEWLAELPDEERQKYISLCNEGKTIREVWRQVVLEPEKAADREYLNRLAEKDHARILQKVDDDIATKSLIDVGKLDDLVNTSLPGTLRDDARQGIRRKLLHAGFVGIGDGEKLYVDPESSNKADVEKAISNRIRGIANDVRNVVRLCSITNTEFIGFIPNLMIDDVSDAVVDMLKKLGVFRESADRIVD